MLLAIEKETKNQADSFALIRFISAIAIVLYHYNKLTGGAHSDPQLPYYSVLHFIYIHGGKLVELFFVMSGFCFVAFYKDLIMQRAIKFRSFIIHRFLKVIPSYWLATFLIILFGLISRMLLGTTIVGAGRSIKEWFFCR